jgi:hypothetical protein
MMLSILGGLGAPTRSNVGQLDCHTVSNVQRAGFRRRRFENVYVDIEKAV